MARDVGIKYLLSAVDKGADKALDGLRSSIVAQGRALRSLSTVGSKAFSSLGFGLIAWNQGLELGRKAIEAWRLTIGGALSKALEFRKMGDGTRETFEQFKKSTNLLVARLGDALLPTFLALAETLTPIVNQVTDWLVVNNKLIASKIVDWTVTLGKVFAQVIVPAVGWVVKIFLGLKATIQGLGIIFLEFANLQNRIFIGVLTNIRNAANALGPLGETISKGLDTAIDSIQGFHDSLDGMSDDLQDGLYDTFVQMEDVDKITNKIGASSLVAIGTFAVNAQKQLKRAVTGTNESLTEQEKLQREAAEKEKKRQEDLDKVRSLAEQRRREWAAELEKIQRDAYAERERHLQQFTVMGDAIGTMFAAWTQGSLSAQQVFASVLDSSLAALQTFVVNTITAHAASAAAAAAASQAHVPIVGPALAVAAAAAMFAFVRGYIGKAFGGGGGGGGSISIPVSSGGGNAGGGGAETANTGSAPTGGGGVGTSTNASTSSGQTVVHNWNIDARGAQNPAEVARHVRDTVVPVLEDLARRRLLTLAPQGGF